MSLLHQPVDHRACLEHGRLQPSGSQTNLVLHESTVLTHAQQLALFLVDASCSARLWLYK